MVPLDDLSVFAAFVVAGSMTLLAQNWELDSFSKIHFDTVLIGILPRTRCNMHESKDCMHELKDRQMHELKDSMHELKDRQIHELKDCMHDLKDRQVHAKIDTVSHRLTLQSNNLFFNLA